MNLMCPARLILVPAEAELPDGERVAAVYASPAGEPVAVRWAAALGVRLTVEPGLDDADALRDIADAHRGETVVLVAPGLDLGLAIPPGRAVVIEHTGDGWSIEPSPSPTDNEVTLAAYEQAAEKFRASIPHGPSEVMDRWLDRIGAVLRPGASVLEIGSGTGEDAVELEKRGYRVRRTDAANSFVEMIRADGYPADLLNALTDDLGGPYDLVFADAVFLHFDRAELTFVLRKAHGAAEWLSFTTREGEGGEWSDRFLDLPRRFNNWQEQPLRDLLTETGWTVTHLERTQTRLGNTWFHILANHS